MISVAPYFNDIEELVIFADKLQTCASIYISRDDATHKNIINIFKSHKQEIMIMSHGEYSHPVFKDNEPAIDENDLKILSPYNIYCYTCNTAQTIAVSYATQGGIWFGYDGRIAMPTPDQNSEEAYKSIFQFIITTFPTIKTVAAANSFLIDLRKVCESAIEMIIAIEPLAIGTEEQAINNIWERLRISLCGGQIQHQNATPGNHRPHLHNNKFV